ncbi:MAG TPA: peptide chain release factor 1 [Acidimicrobiia bacterium]|nr:peptide chain release factor 1 [Acidimicrobiia bacterium]
MFERLADLQAELKELEANLAEIYASGDQDAARDAGRRHAELKPIVDAYEERRRVEADLADARELLDGETDPDMAEYLEGEVAAKSALLEELEARLAALLVPKDPNDGRNVIVEIRGAEGGEEANLWAGDLFRMYERFAERHGWQFEVLSAQASDMGGYRDVTFVARAPNAWSQLKYEGGVHRVQRVPATESQGRIHTSAATVAVLPEAKEVEVALDPNDLEVDVYRSSGPGGQSVNTTDSAVRLTHTPTGLVVTCQDEKSQLQNKEKAMRILRARLLQAEQARQDAELSSTRRGQVKGGGRGEKIRTYNYKESRVTDHRIKLTVHGLPNVLDGDLDGIVEALATAERADQLASPES